MVKEVLHWFSVLQITDMNCPLCGKEKETIGHLFLHCWWVKSLWQSCMELWEVQFCMSNLVNY